jgi:hypothetical protein
MLKKLVLASVVAVASLVSFKFGARTTTVSAPATAAACLYPICKPWTGCQCP